MEPRRALPRAAPRRGGPGGPRRRAPRAPLLPRLPHGPRVRGGDGAPRDARGGAPPGPALLRTRRGRRADGSAPRGGGLRRGRCRAGGDDGGGRSRGGARGLPVPARAGDHGLRRHGRGPDLAGAGVAAAERAAAPARAGGAAARGPRGLRADRPRAPGGGRGAPRHGAQGVPRRRPRIPHGVDARPLRRRPLEPRDADPRAGGAGGPRAPGRGPGAPLLRPRHRGRRRAGRPGRALGGGAGAPPPHRARPVHPPRRSPALRGPRDHGLHAARPHGHGHPRRGSRLGGAGRALLPPALAPRFRRHGDPRQRRPRGAGGTPALDRRRRGAPHPRRLPRGRLVARGTHLPRRGPPPLRRLTPRPRRGGAGAIPNPTQIGGETGGLRPGGNLPFRRQSGSGSVWRRHLSRGSARCRRSASLGGSRGRRGWG